MIVPPDDVVLLRREYMKLQTKLEEMQQEMQSKCDHDLVSELKDVSPIMYKICDICGKEENSNGGWHILKTSRTRKISKDTFNHIKNRLPKFDFLTSDERPIKDIIE